MIHSTKHLYYFEAISLGVNGLLSLPKTTILYRFLVLKEEFLFLGFVEYKKSLYTRSES